MPMVRSKYPEDWVEIAGRAKIKAGWRCENCGARHNPNDPQHILTVHHQDRDPSNNEEWNLIALCARCHLRAEAKLRKIEKINLYEKQQNMLALEGR